MEAIFENCCGIDVHKKTLTACIMIGGEGKITKKEIRTYSTMTEDIEGLRDWLKSEGVTHVAMESTGIYWRPVYNILEEGFEIMLVNARHIKNVPGRKTDVADSEWLCRLLRNGLLNGSFIPPIYIRQLRDLTRYRSKLNNNIAAEKNRLQKYLEDANIKLSSVATDTLGVSGRLMIRDIIKGNTDAVGLSELAKGRLKNKKEELKKSFNSRVTEHHRMLIEMSLKHIEYIESMMVKLEGKMDELIKKQDLAKDLELLDTIPGVDKIGATAIVAEIGADMSKFPTDAHISSWAGMSPGNNESAGKKKSASTTHGDIWIKVVLVQCALAASRTKNTYLRDKYHRLAGRRGKKKAVVAIGHKILVIAYHILKDKVGYKELGGDYLDRRNKDKVERYHVNKLRQLGYDVLLAEKVA